MAGESVLYKDGETLLEGYLAHAGNPDAPMVLVFHQWMGITDHEKERAERLAQEGYNAFAIDMFGKGVRPENVAVAAKTSGIYKNDLKLARRRFDGALGCIRGLSGMDLTRLGAIGFCFGGTMALELARTGLPELKAVVSFHGLLTTPQPVKKPGTIKAAINIQHGADDPLESRAEIEAFKQEMNAAGADWSFTEYAYAVHAFTQKGAGDDPSTGAAYNEKADKRSWRAMIDFFRETLGTP
ncbi:MAG: dienelactone hydrolase family protein [Alphaproteobacteria bacterium]|nr:dienelactone hydrolase family protein [Alphaproteobacteria bacterium]USO07428.1 MAG: dienelactone hydrolase family protein [Rhodospirillales bacterium]